MRGGVYFFELINDDVGVTFGRGENFVPEHGLNEADVSAALVHVGGEGVAEDVGGAAFLDVALAEVSPDPAVEPVARDLAAGVGYE